MSRITKLERLYIIRENTNILIQKELDRKYNEKNRYEQCKAKGNCTGGMSCKYKIVPQHTMCAYHLRKAAIASERRRINK